MDISGSKALVTGATGGLGHAIARRLHAAGARLVITGRRAEMLEPLARELGAEMVVADLTDRQALNGLIAAHADTDILVANAGLPGSGHVHTFTVEEIDRVLDLNVRAAIIPAQQLSASMVERRRGHVVFISSQSARSGQPGSAVYAATKFALRGFSQAMREDLRGTGVGVSCIMPGFIRDAGMFADSGVTLPRGVGTNSPEDVAAAVVRAVERNKGEIDIAPLVIRAGGLIAGFAPALAATGARIFGSTTISQKMTAGQAEKR